MAGPYATGALCIYTGTSGGTPGFPGTPELLGWGEQAPRMEVDTRHGSYVTDLTGGEIPYDFSFAGSMATISVVLTNWDELVAQKLEARPGPNSTNNVGRWKQSDYGAMLMTEKWSFKLWLRYFFGSGPTSKPVYTNAGLPAGYRFANVACLGPWSIEPGSKPMKRQFLFRAWPIRLTTIPSTDPTYILYDQDMGLVQNLPFT